MKKNKHIMALLILVCLTLGSFTLSKYIENQNYSVRLSYTRKYALDEEIWLDSYGVKPTPLPERLQSGIYAVKAWGADGGYGYATDKGVEPSNKGGDGGFVLAMFTYDASQKIEVYSGGIPGTPASKGGPSDPTNNNYAYGGNGTLGPNNEYDGSGYGYGGGGSATLRIDGQLIVQAAGGGGAGNNGKLGEDGVDISGATGGAGGTMQGIPLADLKNTQTITSAYWDAGAGGYVFPGEDGQGHDKHSGTHPSPNRDADPSKNWGGIGGSIANSNNNKDQAGLIVGGAGGGGGFYPGEAGDYFYKMTTNTFFEPNWAKAGSGGGGGASYVKEDPTSTTQKVHIITQDSQLCNSTIYPKLKSQTRPRVPQNDPKGWIRDGYILIYFLGDGITPGQTWADLQTLADTAAP